MVVRYTKEKHLDWCDLENMGITHYGFHPDVLPRGNIRFDIFHLRSAITKMLMEYLRRFIQKQSHEMIQQFSKLMLSFWGDFHVSVWRLNKKNSSFNGNEILLFIRNIPKILLFLKEKFRSDPDINAICDGLSAWAEVTQFLNIVEYESVEHFESSIKKYEEDVKIFYAAGKTSYLSSKTEGDIETFYSHTLRFYMIQFAQTTFEKHKLGLGIFTMQGFERRNKESKNTFRRFTNKKGNTLLSNLKRLWDLFYYENVAV